MKKFEALVGRCLLSVHYFICLCLMIFMFFKMGRFGALLWFIGIVVVTGFLFWANLGLLVYLFRKKNVK